MTKIKKAVIPVAGFGTRFLPITKSVPKMMLPIIDKPILQLIVEEAVQSGIEEILFVVGRNADVITEYFSRDIELEQKLAKVSSESLDKVSAVSSLARYSFVVQNEQRGTAHAVSLARDFVGNEPFLLMFGDDLMYNPQNPVSKQLIEAFYKYEKTVIGCQNVPVEDVPKYASIEYNGCDGRAYFATKIVEKPKPGEFKSTLAPLGRYVCRADIFDYIDKLSVGANGEYQITDAYDLQMAEGLAVAYDFEGVRYDTGDKFGYIKAFTDFVLADNAFAEKYIDYLNNKIKV